MSGHLPVGYSELLEDLKTRIRSAQQKAALAVNHELIQLYWHIGKSVVEHLACDLTAIAEVPDNDPAAHLIREYADVIYDSFTGHGEFGRKGFPILPLFPSA